MLKDGDEGKDKVKQNKDDLEGMMADEAEPLGPPPPKVKPRLFKCIIKDIRLLDNQVSTPVIKFTLGGNYKVVDNRHK